MRVAPAIELTSEQEGELTMLARSKRTIVRLAQRAQIVLLAAQGLQNKEIAEQLCIGRVQVARWRERFLESGLQGIERDLPRGAPPVKVDVAKLVELTTQSTPEAATHWSTRKMAAVLEVSPSTVMRHWQANGLKPHLVRGFKVSRDPKFVEKLEDIVGLYMSPARARTGAVLRREEPSAGAGPHTAGAANEEGSRPDDDARLQAQWHDHAVRCAQCTERASHRPVPATAHPRRMAEVPSQDRPRDAKGQGAASDCRQLRHAQASGRAGLAGQAPALQHALHADVGVLAEYGRALLPRHHRQSPSPWRVHKRARIGCRDR